MFLFRASFYKSSKFETPFGSSTFKDQSSKTNRSKDEDHYTFDIGDVIENRYKVRYSVV